MPIKFDFDDIQPPVLIVDCGYLSHYRIHATYSWYAGTFEIPPNVKEYDWTKDDEYVEMLENRCRTSILSICESYGVSNANTIFAKDCRRSDIWRCDLFPAYKQNRREKEQKRAETEKPNFGSVFGLIKYHILPKMRDYGFKVIGHDQAEADDVIAILKRNIRAEYPERKIIICCNDSDLLQLADENTTFVDLKGVEKDTSDVLSAHNKFKLKFLAGDKKDNVPQVFERCGKGTAQKLYDNPSVLLERLKSVPGAAEQLKLNKLLLSFDNIPDEIEESIMEQYANG